MSEVGNNAGQQLRAFVERILRLKEEQQTIAGDIREIYAEAKGSGFDKTALGQIVAYVSKRDKDRGKFDEQTEIFDLYLKAYEEAVDASHTHVYAREAEIIKGNSSGSSSRQTDSAGETPRPVSPATFSSAVSVGVANEVDGQNPHFFEGGAPEVASPPLSAVTGDEGEKELERLERSIAAAGGFKEAISAALGVDVEIVRVPAKLTLRPHCLNPNLCAGTGREHCHRCRKALAEREAA